jgi:hypothetical protein
MARIALLLVDYGTNNSIHIAAFKDHLKKGGWKPGFIEGVFEKVLDFADNARIETVVQEEVDSAANHAFFKKTCCELFVADDELRFCWDWNTP